MVQKKGRKTLVTTLVVIGVIVLVVAIIVAVRALSSKPTDTTSTTSTNDSPALTEEAEKTQKPSSTTTPEETTAQSTVDPATVSTVSIEPMSLNVSYIKGIGGFDYEVKRAPNGTKYVQFSSTKLVGTKCTDDVGSFASIIDSPTADESTTLAETATVDGTSYGLSLADPTCTSDPTLLQQYQSAFSEAFTLLKKM
jgi:cytoskeletal protein RodZ